MTENPPRGSDLHISRKHAQLWRSAWYRALDFELSLTDVKNLLACEACPLCGMKFTAVGPRRLTIDRVDSTRGYVPGNVRPLCFTCNANRRELDCESRLADVAATQARAALRAARRALLKPKNKSPEGQPASLERGG